MSFRRFLICILLFILLGTGVWSLFAPLTFHDLTATARQFFGLPQLIYPYYFIYEEKSGHHLMTVSVVVTVGDELVSEDDRLYRIIRLEKNNAYARYVRDLTLSTPSP